MLTLQMSPTDKRCKPLTIGDLIYLLKKGKAKSTDEIIYLSDGEGNEELRLYGIEIDNGSVTFIPDYPRQ